MALRSWLKDRKKEQILEKIIEHMQKVLETIHEFERATGFFVLVKESELAYKVFDRVLHLEHEADIMRRDILGDISKIDMCSNMIEDMMTITKRIDNVADEADQAARRIMRISPEKISALGDDVLKCINKLVQKTVETTKLLFNLVKDLPVSTIEEIYKSTDLIQEHEHECDKLHSKIYEKINSHESIDINPFIAIQISQFIDLIENISNKIEDVSDYIELLKTVE